MHLRKSPLYASWEKFWENAHRAPDFTAKYDDTSEKTDWSLSERQLFTQSNGRTLLGQDTMGRLHFACTPHDRIYPVPSGGEDLGGQFKGHIGQYYQNDTALLLGKIKYELEMENGLLLSASNRDSVTEYADYYLPVTATKYPELEIKIFSLAPVMEKEALPLSSIHPLPGPAAFFFCMEVKNTAGCTLKGKVRLTFEQKFVNQFEHYGKRFEDYTQDPYRAEWDQKLLILWHPEACAALQLLGGITEGEASNPRIYAPLELKAGESKVFSAVLALAPRRDQIYGELGVLYQHTPLEWINVTSGFWKERLGQITSEIREASGMGRKYSDMQIRFILDNFNCLSFGESGELLTNWQGAPSHSLSRLWGIDIEPDIVSVMYAVPEVGPKAVEYLLKRNRPRYSLYSDHSMFFYIAPLLIAGKYLELTGNRDYFLENPEITEKLEEVYQGMLAHKHKDRAIFSSHYASDLIVFKKYDYGANVQCYYALKSWKNILEVLGRSTEETEALLARMPADLSECMEADGAFGRQITGGNNLGEDHEGFYIPDELYYYGGEDTATVLAPLYGLYEFDYEPYVNLHRFARSVFITNYDPEFQTMRELHFGMNPSATGATLRLGGSYTRKEMLYSLNLLFDRLDETGSLFWWPRAYNKKRCLTRCSQGQGAWVQQSIEQWYGLRMDGLNKILTLKPQGLLSSYHLQGVHLGSFCFDIQYEENETETVFSVTNRNTVPIQLSFSIRPLGAAAEKIQLEEQISLAAGASVRKVFHPGTFKPQEAQIENLECEAFARQGVLFSPYGIVMPKLSSGDCSIFLLRFVISHTEEEEWKDAVVELEVPEEWRAAPKQFYLWDYQPVFPEDNHALCPIGSLAGFTHGVAGFYVSLPDCLTGDEKSIMLSSHPFPQTPGESPKTVCLYAEGEKDQYLSPITATLKVNGIERAHYILPVQILEHQNYRIAFEEMYHGKKKL